MQPASPEESQTNEAQLTVKNVDDDHQGALNQLKLLFKQLRMLPGFPKKKGSLEDSLLAASFNFFAANKRGELFHQSLWYM